MGRENDYETTDDEKRLMTTGVLGLLQAVPELRHRPGCDTLPRPEPYQSLDRLVTSLMALAEETPRRAGCTGEPMCPRLACLHCDFERAENALYVYRGGDFVVPACCVRPRPIKRYAMRKLNDLAVKYGLMRPFVLRPGLRPDELKRRRRKVRMQRIARMEQRRLAGPMHRTSPGSTPGRATSSLVPTPESVLTMG
jgi:hypothetical protein